MQAFVKKIILNPSNTTDTQEIKYIPLRKFMTALYMFSKDSKYGKVEAIFSMYELLKREPCPKDSINLRNMKDIIDHLYFVILYATPALIDQSHPQAKEILYLKMEMQKRVSYLLHVTNFLQAQTDKMNLIKLFSKNRKVYITK